MANENDRGFNPLGFAGSYASGMFAWDTMRMIHDAPKSGYFIPWTKPDSKGKGRIAWAGRKLNLWGDKGLFLNQPNQLAVQAYQKVARGGLRHRAAYQAAVKALGANMVPEVAAKTAAFAAGSVMIGSAAGVALTISGAAFGIGLTAMPFKWAWGTASGLISKYRGLELGGNFPETQAAVTSRQRNLQAITASNLQARSAIGNEAMLMHRA